MLRKSLVFLLAASLLAMYGCKISGTITGMDGIGEEGVTVLLEGDVNLTTTTDSSGYYEFSSNDIENNTYTVRPTGYTFDSPKRSVDVQEEDVSGIDFSIVGSVFTINVKDENGDAVDGFNIQIDERGKRWQSTSGVVESGSSYRYVKKNPNAGTLIIVSLNGYYSGIKALDPYRTPTIQTLEIRLIPDNQCLEISEECLNESASTSDSEHYMAIGVADWLSTDEVNQILAPYCFKSVDISNYGYTMHAVVLEGDADEIIAELSASDIVTRASASGNSLQIKFEASVPVNAAHDLIEAMPEIRWSKTVLNPKTATFYDEEYLNHQWECTLRNNENIEYCDLMPSSEDPTMEIRP